MAKLTKRIRHFITGEWVDVPVIPGGYEKIVYEGKKESHNCGAISSKRPWSSQALSVPASQAADFNAAARRAGTGARYVPDPRDPNFAICETTTKGARNRELRSRGFVDNEGGFGDYTGR